MKSLSTLFLAAAMALSAHRPAVAQEDGQQTQGPLPTELSQIISGTGWADARWSVMVVSLEQGDTLFAHRPDASLAPASNLKLFTTAAALRYLGPSYRYTTYLTATGPLREGVIQGDLLVYGTGDPTLSDRFLDSKTAVWEALADSLSALGVRRIEGDVIGDASYFAGPGIARGWQTSYVTHTYAAPASALSFNDNIATLRILPADGAGAPPRIQIIPAGAVQLRNEATTVASGGTDIDVRRAGYGQPLVISGQIRAGGSAEWRAVPVVSPPTFAASALRQVLEDRGITIAGAVGRILDPAVSPITGRKVFAPALEDQPMIQVLAVHRSPPLLEILKVINQESHNLYAESVLRTVGRVATGSGSIEGGAAAVAALLEEAGVPTAGLRMDDGSGLSILDRATAGSIVGLLSYMATESPHKQAYLATLPEAATSRGLRRMHETPAAGNLRAKTGTIDRVSALSGYVTTQSGEPLAFSILSNNVPSTWTAKRVEDRIGARLASVTRAAPAATDPLVAAGTTSRPEPAATGTGSATDTTSAAEPGSSTYTIKAGDTLDAIARRHGITVRALQEENPGLDPRRLIPGRSIQLPGD